MSQVNKHLPFGHNIKSQDALVISVITSQVHKAWPFLLECHKSISFGRFCNNVTSQQVLAISVITSQVNKSWPFL